MAPEWIDDVMREFDRIPEGWKPPKLEPGQMLCPRCKGTGAGSSPGETYEEMGTRTFGCSECHSFGWVSKR